jgi:hypothetical protein
MTEDQIERAVERKTNRIDRLFMTGVINEAEYRDAINRLDGWAELQLRSVKCQS